MQALNLYWAASGALATHLRRHGAGILEQPWQAHTAQVPAPLFERARKGSPNRKYGYVGAENMSQERSAARRASVNCHTAARQIAGVGTMPQPDKESSGMKWALGISMRSCVPSGGQGANPRSAQAIWIEPFQKPPAAPPSSLPCPDPVLTGAA